MAHLAFALGTHTPILVETNVKLRYYHKNPRFLNFEGYESLYPIDLGLKTFIFPWVVGVQGWALESPLPTYEVAQSIVTNGVLHGATISGRT